MPVLEQKPVSIASRSAAAELSSVQARSHRAIHQSIEDKVCWIETKQYPYQPDQQVELLHLQAEADALIIKLQATGQRKLAESAIAFEP